MRSLLASCVLLASCASPRPALRTPVAGAVAPTGPIRHVLVVTVDGLKPETYAAANPHQLRIPILRRLVTEGASSDGARRWLAYHIGNELLDPADPELTAADVFARMDRPVDPARWETGFERYGARAPRRFQ